MDSDYLRKHFGGCLTECLSEIAQKRPHDPVEYMSQWLYKYIENENHRNEEAMKAEQLKIEQEEDAKQQERLAKMKEEKDRIAEEAAAKKKEEEEAAAAEAAQKEGRDLSQLPGAPTLPTVAEGEEPLETLRPADEQVQGETGDEFKPVQDQSAEQAAESTEQVEGSTEQQVDDSSEQPPEGAAELKDDGRETQQQENEETPPSDKKEESTA